MRICELRQKEVINCRDGFRLGFVGDVIIDLCNGCITDIIVPGPCKIWGVIGREKEYVIPWCCVRQIGFDIILVDVDIEAVYKKCALE